MRTLFVNTVGKLLLFFENAERGRANNRGANNGGCHKTAIYYCTGLETGIDAKAGNAYACCADTAVGLYSDSKERRISCASVHHDMASMNV